MNVFVTNNGKQLLEDGYAGKRYVFQPGRTIEIPMDAAVHIFGYGKDDKMPCLIRLGWLRMSNEVDLAMKKLGEFSFREASPKIIRASSPVDKDGAGVRLNGQSPAKSFQQPNTASV